MLAAARMGWTYHEQPSSKGRDECYTQEIFGQDLLTYHVQHKQKYKEIENVYINKTATEQNRRQLPGSSDLP